MCLVPCGLEIGAIERDQRPRGFENRVCLFHSACGRRLGSVLPPADHIELADQHSGRGRGGLTDLIERKLDEALEPHRRHPYPEPAASVVPVPFSGGRSASVSSASASQSTHATPVNVSLIAGESARIAISTTCEMPNSLSWVSVR